MHHAIPSQWFILKFKKLIFNTNHSIKEVKKVKKVESLKKVKNFENVKIMWEILHDAITLTIAPNPNP